MELFIYRLALAHRIWNVEEWKREITVGQVKRWMAYWSAEPFGDDWRAFAKLAMSTSEALGIPVGSEYVERFLPTYKPADLSEEQQIEVLKRNPVIRAQIEAAGR